MEELKTYLNVRRNIYKIFSYPFYMEADSAYMEKLGKYIPVLDAIAKEEGNHKADLEEGINLLKGYLGSNPSKDDIEDLACVFARLFFVMNIQAGINGISPQESAYLSENHTMMQAERDEVLKIYCDEGVGRNKDIFKEPEDHLSAEFYFLSVMSDKTLEMIDEGKYEEATQKILVQRDFMENHIMKWIEPLCNDIYNTCDHVFYKGIGKAVLGFVRFDFRQLCDLYAAVA